MTIKLPKKANIGTSQITFRSGGGGGGGVTNGEWRRFNLVGVTPGGTAAPADIYSSLTESAASTVWEMPDYTANPFTTTNAGAGPTNGVTFVRPFEDAGGNAITLGKPFQLRAMIELINVTVSTGNASDWGSANEVEPLMCFGLTAQSDPNNVPTNNFLAVGWSSENNNQPLNSKVGWVKGPFSGSSRYLFVNNSLPVTNTFPTYYYGDFDFGPDFTNNNLNSSLRVRMWQDVGGVQTGIGPNGWSSGNIPSNTDQLANTDAPLYLFCSISPRVQSNYLLNQRNNAQVTVTFRCWYMVNYITGGWTP